MINAPRGPRGAGSGSVLEFPEVVSNPVINVINDKWSPAGSQEVICTRPGTELSIPSQIHMYLLIMNGAGGARGAGCPRPEAQLRILRFHNNNCNE